MRRSFGIAALAAGILSVSACGPAGRGPEAPALQEESRETEGTQETKEIQKTEEARESFGIREEAERPEDGKTVFGDQDAERCAEKKIAEHDGDCVGNSSP